MNIPCYIINLEKEKEKKTKMKQVCKRNNIQPTFINAIYGKNLEKEYIQKICNQSEAKKNLGRELTPGEIGVALSQLSIYKKMLSENIEVALIFEDDVDFRFSENYLKDLIKKLPNDWECLMLGHHTKRSRDIDTLASVWFQLKLNDKEKIVRFAESPFGAYAYLINLSGAKKMLKEYEIINKPIDHWNDRIINLYGINPSVVNVDDENIKVSLLHEERTNTVVNRNFTQKIKDKIKNILIKMKLLNIYFRINNYIKRFRTLYKYN